MPAITAIGQNRANETRAKKIYAIAHDGIPLLPSSAASTKMLTPEAVKVLQEINRKGGVVVMDNARFHRKAVLRERANQLDAMYCF